MNNEKNLVEVYLETECEIRLDELAEFPETLDRIKKKLAIALITDLPAKDFDALFKFKTFIPGTPSIHEVSDKRANELYGRNSMILRAGIKLGNHE